MLTNIPLLLLLAVYHLKIIVAAPLDSRDLGDLLGGDDDTDPFGLQTTERTSRTMQTVNTLGLSTISTDDLVKSKTSSSVATSTRPYSIMSTTTSSHANLPSVTIDLPKETATATQTPSSTSTSNDSKQWKIIGIAVIVISVVAAVIFVIVFFDQWWRFLRDVVLGRKTSGWKEDLVPDWEKRSWEFKLASDEYPPSSEPPSKQQGGSPDYTRHPFPERPIRFPSSPEAVGLGLTGCGTYRARRSFDEANEVTVGTDAHVKNA